jgi:hypothetical protein
MSVITNAQGTLLGPLTTTFIFPETCTVNFQVFPGHLSLYQGQRCVTDLDDRGSPLQDNHECWPPAEVGIEPPQHPFVGWGYYSPGLVCPTGYTSACSATFGEESGWDNQFRLRPSETAIGCCPECVLHCLHRVWLKLNVSSGFACTNSNGNKCVAIITETTTAPVATCSGTNMVNSVLATITPDDTRDRVTLWAPLFQLNHQPTDSTPTSRPTGSEQNEGDEDSETKNEDLSTMARVGIGIGVTASAAIALAGAVWFGLNRRRRRKQPDFDVTEYIHAVGHKSVYSVGSKPSNELQGSYVVELPQQSMPVELPSERWTRYSSR